MSNNKLEMLNIFLTTRCNLNCNYCSSTYIQSKNESINLSLIERIDQEIIKSENGLFYPIIRLTGGEPFLYSDIFRVLNVLKRSPRIEISTNGLSITTEILKKLEDYKIMLNLSIHIDDDGNIVIPLSKIESILQSHIITNCIVVATSNNHIYLDSIFNELEKCGSNNIIIVGLKPSIGKSHPEEHYLSEGNIEYIENLLEQRNRKSNTNYYFQKPELMNSKNMNIEPGCSCACNQLSILPNGDVIPCNTLLNFVIGNCNESNIFDLYESERAVFIRELAKLDKEKLHPCNECEKKDICNTGSRVKSYLNTGDWLSVDPLAFCSEYISRLSFNDHSLNNLYNKIVNRFS